MKEKKTCAAEKFFGDLAMTGFQLYALLTPIALLVMGACVLDGVAIPIIIRITMLMTAGSLVYFVTGLLGLVVLDAKAERARGRR